MNARPRISRDELRGLAAGRRVCDAGGSAMEAALAAIDATFSQAAVINGHKQRVERYIRMSFGHPEVRARYRFHSELFAAAGVDLDQACIWLRRECATRAVSPFAKTIRFELHIILRWLRRKRMHKAFAETLSAIRAPALEAAE